MKTLKKCIPIIIMAAIAASAVLFVAKNGSITVDMLTNYIPRTPRSVLLAAGVMLVLYAVKSQTVIVPYAILATAAGVMFDLPVALAVNTLGSVICISVPYFTGHASDGVLLEGILKKSPKLRELLEESRDNTFVASLVMRILNFSNDLLGLLFGSLKVPYMEYLLSSFIGIVPSMVMYTVLGDDMDPFSRPSLICFAVELSGVLITFIYVHLRRKRKRAQ